MMFARWQHHIRFGSGFPYATLKAMLTKISKWSRIQDSFRTTPKIESLVVFAIPDIPRKFQKDPSITFRVILLTHRQTDRQTNKVWQKHSLLGGGNNNKVDLHTMAKSKSQQAPQPRWNECAYSYTTNIAHTQRKPDTVSTFLSLVILHGSAAQCHARFLQVSVAKFPDFSPTFPVTEWQFPWLYWNNNPITQMSKIVHYRVGWKKPDTFER